MKKLNKSWVVILLCLITAAFGVCFTACNHDDGPNNDSIVVTEVIASDNYVAITVVDAPQNSSLLAAMKSAQSDGKLTFTIKNGMVTDINGITQTENAYWLLYTSDKDNANASWGTYTYNGQTLDSSIFGAEDLPVKVGCVYVWVYTKF